MKLSKLCNFICVITTVVGVVNTTPVNAMQGIQNKLQNAHSQIESFSKDLKLNDMKVRFDPIGVPMGSWAETGDELVKDFIVLPECYTGRFGHPEFASFSYNYNFNGTPIVDLKSILQSVFIGNTTGISGKVSANCFILATQFVMNIMVKDLSVHMAN